MSKFKVRISKILLTDENICVPLQYQKFIEISVFAWWGFLPPLGVLPHTDIVLCQYCVYRFWGSWIIDPIKAHWVFDRVES